jgi:hypothetical protein
MLDGGWWPTSRDPVVELCSLVIALNAQRAGGIERIMLNPTAWDGRPRRIGVGGVVLRVGWFTTLDPALIILTGPRDLRIDLVVIPPQTAFAVATAAMHAAFRAGNTTRAADILPPPRQAGSRPPAQPGDPEGGQLPANRRPTAPARR